MGFRHPIGACSPQERRPGAESTFDLWVVGPTDVGVPLGALIAYSRAA